MRRALLAATAALALATAAPADTRADTQADTTDLATQYVNLPAVQQMMDEMFSPAAMAAQFRNGVPPTMQIPDDKLARIGAVMSAEMQSLREPMMQLMIEQSAANFTEDELRAMLDFYGSDRGAAIMRKTQPFFQAVMAGLAPRIQATQQTMVPQITAILQSQD